MNRNNEDLKTFKLWWLRCENAELVKGRTIDDAFRRAAYGSIHSKQWYNLDCWELVKPLPTTKRE